MSIFLEQKSLQRQEISRIKTDLEVTFVDRKGYAPDREVTLYSLKDETVALPFNYAVTTLKKKRRPRTDFRSVSIEFIGKLRDEQEVVKKEALDMLNKTGSTMLSLYTGGGKCLGKDTPVLMFDGSIKAVQDIIVGDKLMGDDSTCRNVLSICQGTEQMYRITPTKGESFTCNESHILSLKISGYKNLGQKKGNQKWYAKVIDKNTLKYVKRIFDTEENAKEFLLTFDDNDIIDISVKDYLSLPQNIIHILKLYRALAISPSIAISLFDCELGSSSNKIRIDTPIDRTLISTNEKGYDLDSFQHLLLY